MTPTGILSVLGALNQDSFELMVKRVRAVCDDTSYMKLLYIMEALAKHHLSEKSLLDVGCGSGKLLMAAKKLGMNPTGIDVYSYEDTRRDAEARLLANGFSDEEVRSSILTRDASRPLDADMIGRFDFVVSAGMLEHLPQPVARAAAVANMVAALAPGGVLLLIGTPNILFPVDLFHYGPRYPFYHQLPDRWKTRYMATFISRSRFEGYYRTPEFLAGLSVGDICRTIVSTCPGIELVRAFPALCKLGFSRPWMRNNSLLRELVWHASRVLTAFQMEPVIFVIARRPCTSTISAALSASPCCSSS